MKRRAEEEVLESIKAQLPIVGEKGTILDYEEGASRKKNKLNTKYKEKKIDGSEEEGAFYGGDVDQWQAYCEQYFEYYGVYPDVSNGQENKTGKDLMKKSGNSLYAIPTSTSNSSAPQQSKKKQLVADYPSSDDEE